LLRWKICVGSPPPVDFRADMHGLFTQGSCGRPLILAASSCGVILARTRAGSIVTLHRPLTAIWLAGFFALGAAPRVEAMPILTGTDVAVTADDAPSPSAQVAQAQPQPTPTPAATPTPQPDANAPADQQAASDEPIGNVASLTGVATVIRNKDSIALKLKDDIYLNDTVQTAASSTLGITFNDATTFHLSANAKITIDTYVYEDGGSNNSGAFDIAKGTVAFVAAQVAKTGNMQITTPTATLGIRGTTGLVEVPEDGTAANANNVNIKLYPDADGHVGRIEVNDRQGARLGALSTGASGFAIRPGTAGARFAAVPITISPQQQARDQGFVRQVHATQTVGRQIVTEQRAFRRANPGINNRNNPARPGQPGQQPGQNRPGQPGQPQRGQNRPGQPQQPGTPNNRQGNGQGQRPGQPGQPGQGGQPARPGQPGQPGQPVRPGETTPPANPATPGTPSRAGQNTPAGPAQPGTPPRPGQTAQPARPGQPGAPTQPNGVPRTGQPTGQPTPPPLPHGQPLLRQSGPPRPAGGLQRPGLQNRPALQRPKPPPKDKKKR
jgi:FecR protein